MQKKTSLGLDERIERVLAYSLFWISGLILYLVEKNRTVRWHAAQSMLTFGTLSLLSLVVSIFRGMLHWIPMLHVLTDFGLGLLLDAVWWTTVLLWIWLMVMAWLRPGYRLPFVSNWVRFIV